MKTKEEIYKDLINNLNQKQANLSKKDIFLENLNYVKTLLQSGLSTKKQIEKYSIKVETISRSSYEKYCKEFLKYEYEKSILKSLFYRNIKAIAYYICHKQNPTSYDLYLSLLKKGSLKQAKNKKESSMQYEDFVLLLKEFLKNKGYENLIEFESNKVPKISSTKKENKNTKIKVDFIDDSFEFYDEKFLKKDFIVHEDSYIDNNIKEKNVYYIQARYIDKEYSFENFKELIKNEDIIENYSIIIHNNASVDTRLYIYRFIDNNLLMLRSLDASSCVFELDELIRRARDNFFEKFDSYLNKICSN